jgi:hypothetical protein
MTMLPAASWPAIQILTCPEPRRCHGCNPIMQTEWGEPTHCHAFGAPGLSLQ